MRGQAVAGMLVLILCAPAVCQESSASKGTVPIYRVTVIERTIQAVNYHYRSAPTPIDFRGTVLMPKAKGQAIVQSRQGRTEIDAKFENLMPPTPFGREYLSYVLWAITPEGGPRNLGSIVTGGSNKGSLRVTTDLQAFAMIVTAEPYSAVRLPSDVVVLENRVRSDTMGKIKEVTAKYELMPRGHYTWQMPANLESGISQAPKVSMKDYEALLSLYEAQNAVGIARAANAERYAPNTFAKAQQLLEEARRWEANKGGERRAVQSAREAAQTAEDARLIAERRAQDEKLATAQAQTAQAEREKARAEQEVQRARTEAQAALERADSERAARNRAEEDAAAARERAAQAEESSARAIPRVVVTPPNQREVEAARKAQRMKLLEELNGVMATRDTPRGLVATMPDSLFSGVNLTGTAQEQLRRVTRVITANPGLKVVVEGHAHLTQGASTSWRRAEMVGDLMVAQGLPRGAVSARGLGDSRPLVHNASPRSREENERVEIVIAGDPIGTLAFWDRSYSLMPR